MIILGKIAITAFTMSFFGAMVGYFTVGYRALQIAAKVICFLSLAVVIASGLIYVWCAL